MGAAVSKCATACCGCCCGDGSKWTKSRASETSTVQHDRDDAWFEQDNVPLLSATQDDNGSVVRKVMGMRSPRHAEPAASSSPRRGLAEVAPSSPSRWRVESASPKRGVRENEDPQLHSPRQTWGDNHDDSPNSSNDDDSWELASLGRTSGNEQSPPLKMRSPRSQLSGGSSTEHDEAKSTSRSPDNTSEHKHRRSHRSVSATSHESGEALEDDGGTTGSPRLPRSPGRPASASSSPKRKPRYGRKHYRANSSRQKSL
jgi:hypothetical protein